MGSAARQAFAALTLAMGVLASPAFAAAETTEASAADSPVETVADAAAEPAVDTAVEPADQAPQDSEDQVPPPSDAALRLADWVIASRDNGGLPFAVVDKTAAQVFVYAPDGQPLGATTALLGLAEGDDSVPGIGDRPLYSIRPEERTTPAGRFVGAYGPAARRRKVLWVDFATAISLHPVATANPRERRMTRLKSPTAKDNRITYGCINVAADFYEAVVRPTFTGSGGVFYVLPETKPLAEVFPAMSLQAHGGGPAEPVGEVNALLP